MVINFFHLFCPRCFERVIHTYSSSLIRFQINKRNHKITAISFLEYNIYIESSCVDNLLICYEPRCKLIYNLSHILSNKMYFIMKYHIRIIPKQLLMPHENSTLTFPNSIFSILQFSFKVKRMLTV